MQTGMRKKIERVLCYPASRKIYWVTILSMQNNGLLNQLSHALKFYFDSIRELNRRSNFHRGGSFCDSCECTCLWRKWMLILVSVLHRSTILWNRLSQNSLTGNFIASSVECITFPPMWINENTRPITETSMFTLLYLMTMWLTKVSD